MRCEVLQEATVDTEGLVRRLFPQSEEEIKAAWTSWEQQDGKRCVD